MSVQSTDLISMREEAARLLKQDPKCFPLLALPTEIVHMIYKEVFSDSMVRVMSFTGYDTETNSRKQMVRYYRPTSHRNLLYVSKQVYQEAIDIYWRTSLVSFVRDSYVDPVPPAELGTGIFTKVNRLRLDNRLNIEDMVRQLPNLKELQLFKDSIVGGKIGLDYCRSDALLKTVLAGRSGHLFPSVPEILRCFPHLLVTGQIDVYLMTVDQDGVPHNGEEVSLQSLSLSFRMYQPN